MTATMIAGAGILLNPRPDSPGDAITEAEQLLGERGLDAWDIYELQLGKRLSRTWWAGAEHGFVSDDWPDAVPVAVIPLPAQYTEDVEGQP